jgi:Hyaluronan / mRNA binding family
VEVIIVSRRHATLLDSFSSLTRKGIDGRLRKEGAGAHNWGSIQDEIDYEAEAYEEFEGEEGEEDRSATTRKSDEDDKKLRLSKDGENLFQIAV